MCIRDRPSPTTNNPEGSAPETATAEKPTDSATKKSSDTTNQPVAQLADGAASPADAADVTNENQAIKLKGLDTTSGASSDIESSKQVAESENKSTSQ